MTIPLKISSEKQGEKETIEHGLIDSGAGGKFIDQNFARSQKYYLQKLDEEIKVLNVDGTLNKRGTIKHYVDLDIDILEENSTFGNRTRKTEDYPRFSLAPKK